MKSIIKYLIIFVIIIAASWREFGTSNIVELGVYLLATVIISIVLVKMLESWWKGETSKVNSKKSSFGSPTNKGTDKSRCRYCGITYGIHQSHCSNPSVLSHNKIGGGRK